MELKGNAADRWQQVSDKLAEIAVDIAAKQELVKDISSTLEELGAELKNEQKLLDKLSNLALKEVLREESGTLNDEPPVVSEPVQADPVPKKQIKEHTETSTKETSKKSSEIQKQPETLPLLSDADSPEVDQSKQQES